MCKGRKGNVWEDEREVNGKDRMCRERMESVEEGKEVQGKVTSG